MEFGSGGELNEELQKMTRIAEDIITYCLKNTRENPLLFLKKTFTPDMNVSILEQRKDFIGNLDVYFSLMITSNRKGEELLLPPYPFIWK